MDKMWTRVDTRMAKVDIKWKNVDKKVLKLQNSSKYRQKTGKRRTISAKKDKKY